MKFKVDDEVKINYPSSEEIGKYHGTIQKISSVEGTRYYMDGLPRETPSGYGIFWYDEELELVPSFTKEELLDTTTDFFLVSPSDNLNDSDVIATIGTKDELLTTIESQYEIGEYQVYKLVPAFRVKLEMNTRIIEEG